MRLTIPLKERLVGASIEALKDWHMRAPRADLETSIGDLPKEIIVEFSVSFNSCFALGFLKGREDKRHHHKHRSDALNPFHVRRFDSPIVWQLYDVWGFGYYVACYIKLPAAQRTPTGRPKKNGGTT